MIKNPFYNVWLKATDLEDTVPRNREHTGIFRMPIMPRVRQDMLDCCIYLYQDPAQADVGESIGGTGFLVCQPTERWGHCAVIYAVTNTHVVRGTFDEQGNRLEVGCPVIRINTKDGKSRVIALTENDWHDHPGNDDLSCALLELDPQTDKFKAVPTFLFGTFETIREWGIGPGDDVFMVGRLARHGGQKQNLPITLFGHIAMMPEESFLNARNLDSNQYIVQMRSIGGYSGSPIYAYIPANATRYRDDGRLYSHRVPQGPWLLGVVSGHVSEYAGLRNEDQVPDGSGRQVEINSGLASVVPAWELPILLGSDEVKAERAEIEAEAALQSSHQQPLVMHNVAREIIIYPFQGGPDDEQQ